MAREIFFFFFQAEDGIRDWSVTGVQTCALPIFAHRTAGQAKVATSVSPSTSARRRATLSSRPQRTRAGPDRSEERRVGKSVDLGGRRIIKKKKEKMRLRRSRCR